MIINNHFSIEQAMDEIVDKLNDAFFGQDFARTADAGRIDEYRAVARCYARVENVIAVLSDLRARMSYIYCGKFGRMLGVADSLDGAVVGSIWEDCVLRFVHPDDLHAKYLHELRFFQFVKDRPRAKRADYCMMEKLRMRDASGFYRMVLHRLCYLPMHLDQTFDGLRMALCLYGPLAFDIQGDCRVVDMLSGQVCDLGGRDDSRLLSAREKDVLRLIGKGLMSKHIAERLGISVNTVSRHRQKILEKLRAGNSIEAFRMAESLGII